MTSTSWSQESYIKAYKFAAAAHQGQTVPGPQGLPYIMHLSFVSMEVIASLAEERGRDENLAVQSALLHDILEDTATTYAQVAEQFGVAVADGVLALTKDATLPKAGQMADSLHRIRQQPPEISMVKLADRITNLQASTTSLLVSSASAIALDIVSIFASRFRTSFNISVFISSADTVNCCDTVAEINCFKSLITSSFIF